MSQPALPMTADTPPGKPMRSGVLRRFAARRSGLVGLAIVAAFLILALAGWAGLTGNQWSAVTGAQWEGATSSHWFGTNRLGQDVLARAIESTNTAFEVGLLVALLSTALGALMGAIAGWRHGGIVDEVIVWFMGVIDSIPFYLFAAALAFALAGHSWAMHLAMILTFWTTTSRLIRGEVMRLKQREFVQSARAIGLPGGLILARHVLPNTAHILLVQVTLTLVAAIKTEVILSFLGLGMQDGVSWGLMLAESSQDVLAGHFGNFLAASTFLFTLLLGFNLLADALQDALDVRGTAS